MKRFITLIMAGALLGAAGAAVADNSRQAATWQLDKSTDAMTNVVTTSVDGDAKFPDGHEAQLTATCAPSVISITITAFDGPGQPFDWDGNNNAALRVKIDGNDVTNITVAQGKYTNEVTVYFFDSDSYDTITSADEDSDDGLSGIVSMLSDFGERYVIAAAAGGTEEQLAGAQSVLVDMPLNDGSDDVVDLNPTDTTLAPFIASCVQSTNDALAKIQAVQNGKIAQDKALLAQLTTAANNGDANAQCYLYELYNGGTASYRDANGNVDSTSIDSSLEDASKASYWQSQLPPQTNGTVTGNIDGTCNGPPAALTSN